MSLFQSHKTQINICLMKPVRCISLHWKSFPPTLWLFKKI